MDRHTGSGSEQRRSGEAKAGRSRGRLKSFRRNDGYDRWDGWLAWPLVVLGLAFIVVLILPLAHPISPKGGRVLDLLNVTIWLAFAIDYLARLYLAESRRTFIRTHVLDLIVVVVPFLRPFRLLRLFAIVASTTRRAGGVVVRQVTLYVIGVSVIVIAAGAIVVFDAEQKATDSNIRTLGDAFWWAITTVTTVGYGDRYPVTGSGKLVAAILMVTGIALLGTITAAVAAWFVNVVRQANTAENDQHAAKDQAHILAELQALRSTVDALRVEVIAGRERGDSRERVESGLTR